MSIFSEFCTYNAKYRVSIPEAHVVGITSVKVSVARLKLMFGLKRKVVAGCLTDIETKESEVILHPNATALDLAHEVGHHVWANFMRASEFATVWGDWRKATQVSDEELILCGLTDYSLTDGEEFFADAYSMWAMAETLSLHRLAKERFKELFSETASLLDRLFEEEKNANNILRVGNGFTEQGQ